MAYERYSNLNSNNGRTTTHRPAARSTILNFEADEESREDTTIREALLRESGHLDRSEQLLDEQFDLALKTRENLIHQRSTINSMRDGYNNIVGRFTSVNELIKRIRIRKRRDTIIVAIVFSICLCLLLYHLFL